MEVDILALKWKGPNGHLFKVTALEELNDLTLMWYKDIGTGEVHCMSSNIFTLLHEAQGSLFLINEDS